MSRRLAMQLASFHLSAPSPPAHPPTQFFLLQVDASKQRFAVALKQSLCRSADGSYLRSLFG
jgi:hypothetical protein